MTEKYQTTARNPICLVTAILVTLALAFAASPAAFAEDSTTNLFENLKPVEDAAVGMAYIDPEADFSVFKRVKMLDTFVAFRSGWQRDQSRGSRSNRVSSNDMDRI